MCTHYFGAKSAFEIKKIVIAHRYVVVIMLASTMYYMHSLPTDKEHLFLKWPYLSIDIIPPQQVS